MNEEEKKLLLIVARILRAHLNDHVNEPDFPEIGNDWVDLHDALMPYDGVPFSEIINNKEEQK